MADEPSTTNTTQGRGANQKWIKRKWADIDNWQCNVGECIFDSFDEGDMPLHYDAVHGPNATVVPPPSPAPAQPIN
jgi:hypothetical protein